MRITISFDDGAKHAVLHCLDTDRAVEALRKRGLVFVADAVKEAAALGDHVLDKYGDAQVITLDEVGVSENEGKLAHSSDEEERATDGPPQAD